LSSVSSVKLNGLIAVNKVVIAGSGLISECSLIKDVRLDRYWEDLDIYIVKLSCVYNVEGMSRSGLEKQSLGTFSNV